MKLTDFLDNVGRPVAYYPGLRRITGSTNATILLCQFIYWRGKESGQDGWLYKKSDEIEQETGLSYDEQKTARAKLVSAGLIEERYARLDHQMKFRVNLDAINEQWGNTQSGFPEHGITALGKAESELSLNESENTAENTINITPQTSKPAKRGDLVDMYLQLSQSPGIKAVARRDALLSALGERLHINASGKRWEMFARFADDRQQLDGQNLITFLDWMTAQKGFDLQFWPPSKMAEQWPRAFIEIEETYTGYPKPHAL